jgi:beta-lactamase class D
MHTGWWVGYLETPKGVYFFATNLIQDRKFNKDDFGACRKVITKKVFKQLKIISMN